MARALIPNSTQIPDLILDHWMAELSGAEFKVLLYIARRTYGFGKDRDTISLSQIAHGLTRRDGTVLDRGTGVSRASVARALKVLEERGAIVRKTNLSAKTREFEENTYSINLGWAPPAGQGGNTPPEGASPGGGQAVGGVVSKRDHLASKGGKGWSRNETRVVSKLDPQETALQETDQETTAATQAELPEGEGQASAAVALLVEDLVSRGVGRAAAEQLARDKPAVCRRCLQYLPFAKVRTTPGAWLANAIRGEYGPPEGYLKRQAAQSERAPDNGPVRQGRISRETTGHATIDSRLKDSYGLLEKTRPDAITAFSAYLAAEKDRARKFAARLSLRRGEEYLASFDSEEHRLGAFARWLQTEGRGFVSSGAQGEAIPNGHGQRASSATP